MLENLQARFAREVIYTYVGDILVAINPFKWIKGIYDVSVMEQCKGNDGIAQLEAELQGVQQQFAQVQSQHTKELESLLEVVWRGYERVRQVIGPSSISSGRKIRPDGRRGRLITRRHQRPRQREARTEDA